MSYNNSKIHKATAYVPNTNALSAPTLAAGDLASVAFNDTNHEFVGKRWGAVSPSVKIALLGLTANGSLKCGAFSAAATPAAPLTAGHALQITVPDTELADNPAGVIVIANEGSGNYKYVGLVPLQAQFMRENVVPDEDLVITIPYKPFKDLEDASLIDKALAADNAAVYGVTGYDFGLELGDAGISYGHNPTNFETNANGINYRYPVNKGQSVTLNMNPMRNTTFDLLLRLGGAVPFSGGYSYGQSMPLQGFILDIDEDPKIDSGSKFQRHIFWNLGSETLEALTIGKQYNNKEGAAVVLPCYTSVYTGNILSSVYSVDTY